jgi:hypothetical protein
MMTDNKSRKVHIIEPSLYSKLNKQTSSLSLESRHSIQSSYDSTRTYQRRVSFDNVTNISPAFHSYTLKQCSRGFERTRRSRTFIVAIDLDSNKIEPLIFALTVVYTITHIYVCYTFKIKVLCITCRILWMKEMKLL